MCMLTYPACILFLLLHVELYYIYIPTGRVASVKKVVRKKTQKGDEHNIACYNLQLKYTNFRQEKSAVHAHNLSQR